MNYIERQSFNPRQFSSCEDISSSLPEEDDLISKGKNDTLVINMAKFANKIDYFSTIPDKKICDLDSEEKKNFELIVRYVELVYDTNGYDNLYKIVEEKCKHIDQVKPGTIGGYLCGCLTKSTFPIAGCSPICASGMPLPKDNDKYPQCEQMVILAETNSENRGYNFTLLKHSDSDKPAIIHLDISSLHNWHGFSREEKEELRKMGCSKIYIYGYSSEHNDYIDLIGTHINLNEVKTRTHRKYHKTNDGISALTILCIIVLIIIILFFTWLVWGDKTSLK